MLLGSLIATLLLCGYLAESQEQSQPTLLVTHQVYLNVSIDGVHTGRIVIGLFGKLVPRTVRNFYQIATKGINGVTYAGSPFHRIEKRFMIQGGDIVNGNGSGVKSIFGGAFEDENFILKHNAAGMVSMANSGPHTNGCQFFILTAPALWLDGDHVAFGKVIKGMSVVQQIDKVPTIDGRPNVPVVIKHCGSIPTPEPFDISPESSLTDLLLASTVPLGMSLAILSIFHWFIKKLNLVDVQ